MNQNNNTSGAKPEATAQAARWLSVGFEELELEDSRRNGAEKLETAYDVVIVGSGYGGALAAAELAGGIDAATGQPARICVLERGREYLAGMFPGSEADLPGSLKLSAPNSADPYSATDGVLDIRAGTDVTVMLASGLGGGSLINAGVMAVPEKWVFDQPCWPKALRNRDELRTWYDAARTNLAPNDKGVFSQATALKKQDALFRLYPSDPKRRGNLEVQPPQVVDSYIAQEKTTNSAGVPLEACKKCGDCMTGCNQRAKNSLDQNCLVKARRRGARIVCGATVLKLTRDDERDQWVLHILHTDPLLRRRQDEPFQLRTRRVVLAAGTLGSTEILLRSRSEALPFSSHLGERFSTNGDLIAASYHEKEVVNAVASEFEEFDARDVGPTITGMLKAGTGEGGIAIQELAVPGAIRRLFAEGFTTSHLFHRLATRDPDGLHLPGAKGTDPYSVNDDAIAKTQVLGVIGHDGAGGSLYLKPLERKDEHGDDAPRMSPPDRGIHVHWPELREEGGIFDTQMTTLASLVETSGSGGVLLSNPTWQLLPQKLSSVLNIPRGPALTTHPLGGCGMADTWHDGVVDEFGRVFDTHTDTSCHAGLVVLDGSIIPRSLGINPAFTISAIALRALAKLRAEWQTGAAREDTVKLPSMPIFKEPHAARDVPTEIVIRERMVGDIHLSSDASEEAGLTVELTLEFKPISARVLAKDMDRQLELKADKSFIRLFEPKVLCDLRDRGESEVRCDQHAAFVAQIGGHMKLLGRGWSTPLGRKLRALYAWYHNRGKRDTWNSIVAYLSGTAKRRRNSIIAGLGTVASHAGEIRLFEYELEVGEPMHVPRLEPKLGRDAIQDQRRMKIQLPRGTRISGFKRITYARASNPWKQMSEMKLTRFPGLDRSTPTTLALEPKYFARDQKHLFEIVRERDGATGLFELFSFLIYTLRLVAAIHLWSFRKPDAPNADEPKRLPDALPGLRPPSIRLLQVATLDGKAVYTRLARYRRDGASLPVLLIHGFSASGTTFAHPALKPGLAQSLYGQGRDVWVIDLRTSSGLRSSRHPWDFEDVARKDIPMAIAHILRETGADKLDVVAHCMGAAMFSMAVLEPTHIELYKQIRSVVLSQVGPMVVFTPANVFRAYAVSYIQQVFRESNFEFRPTPGVTSAFLDRALATVPYPSEEFEFENPGRPCKRTPFTATRHRMDAWFGRVFNLVNMDAEILERIDDFFGAINLRTSFQTIQFARNSMITTRRGRNLFITPKLLERWRAIPVFSIHGAKNGLSDPATLVRMQVLMEEMRVPFQRWLVPEFGHQDCIMGRAAARVIFPEIRDFLATPESYVSPELRNTKAAPITAAPAKKPFSGLLVGDRVFLTELTVPMKFTAQPPWLGPVVGMPNARGVATIALCADPKFDIPKLAVTFEVTRVTEEWRREILEKITSGKRPWVEHSAKPSAQRDDSASWYWLEQAVPDDPARRGSLVLLIYNMPAIFPDKPWTHETVIESSSASSSTSRGSNPSGFGNDGFADLLKRQRGAAIAEAVERLLCSSTLDELQQAVGILPAPPVADATCLRFAFASCQYPAGPLDPSTAAASYKRIRGLIDDADASKRPRCVLLVGDQVYVDSTAGIFDPSQKDDRYELPYHALLQVHEVRDVLRRLPMYATLDDHEIDNNWEPDLLPGDKSKERRLAGRAAYFKFQRAAGPPRVPPLDDPQEPAWYRAEIDGFQYFFGDTRSEREKRTVEQFAEKSIMGVRQFDDLLDWLAQPSIGRPRFVITASILFPRRKLSGSGPAGALRSDAWDGYPGSMQRLLAFIANRNISDLVFLSGDEHHSCIATVHLTLLNDRDDDLAAATVLHSIHSSGLNAPFTFANGEPADLAGAETFSFPNPERSERFPARSIRCSVSTQFVDVPGDGFAVLDCARASERGGWMINCEFSRPGIDNNRRFLLDAKTAHRWNPGT